MVILSSNRVSRLALLAALRGTNPAKAFSSTQTSSLPPVVTRRSCFYSTRLHHSLGTLPSQETLPTNSTRTTSRMVSSMTTTTSTNNSIFTTDTKKNAPLVAEYAWSITASVNPDGDYITVDRVEGYEDETTQQKTVTQSSNHPIEQVGSRQFDITQSTEWMEYLEYKENRMDHVGGAGAYDTMRCDLVLSSPKSNVSINGNNGISSFLDREEYRRIWGEEYHLNRLRESYKSLFKATKKDENAKVNENDLEIAMKQSKATLERLLVEAEKSGALAPKDSTHSMTENDDTIVQLLRLTLLWSPPLDSLQGDKTSACTDTDKTKIVVRGHACSSCRPMKIHSSPDPIVVSVAVHTDSDDNNHGATIDESLPTRYADPQNKIASWCRLRKTMENPNTYKPPGISEVLMVRKRVDVDGKPCLEVLEGLSSNFFVIDKHGCLRTATEGVLNGYVRHLVLECANKCGLKFDPRPIYLHEASEWKEAFITSSSRLIYPISKILLPEDHNHEDVDANMKRTTSPGTTFVEYWQDPYFLDTLVNDVSNPIPKWQELLNEILKAGGYSSVSSSISSET